MKTDRVQSCSKGGYHHLTYYEWGDPSQKQVIVCAHGLTRTGRDFDTIAKRLCDTHRVISFDFAGRGQSDWLAIKQDYDYPQYLVDATVLLARIHAEHLTWLGTSMGGILGITMASLPDNPIQRLIVNDVGPVIPKSALSRIGGYVGNVPTFKTKAELEQFCRQQYASFGDLTDAQWQHITEYSHRVLDNGELALHYDPGIAESFKQDNPADIEFWPVWDRIQVPTLVLRGEQSDLLMADTAEQMTRRGPKADLHVIANTGHAPSLMTDDQIQLIQDWLNANQ